MKTGTRQIVYFLIFSIIAALHIIDGRAIEGWLIMIFAILSQIHDTLPEKEEKK